MYQSIIFYVTERLFQANNKERLAKIVQKENYKAINRLIEKILSEELEKHSTIDEPEAILMRNLQYKLLEQNNNSIYKTLSQLEEVEENIAIISMHRSKIEDKIKGNLYLIDTCLSAMQQKIEDIALLQIKKVMMEIIFKFYLENKQLSSQEFTDILRRTTLDHKALLGCGNTSMEESYIQYSLSDYKEFEQQALEPELKEDKVDKMESTRYWLYQEVNSQYKDKIKRYLDEDMLIYLQNILDDWILHEAVKDSNSDLICVSKIWKKVLKELKKIYQKKQRKNSDTDGYQKRLVLTTIEQ